MSPHPWNSRPVDPRAGVTPALVALIVLFSSLAPACGGDNDPVDPIPGDSLAGTIRVDLSGDRSGRFEAVGRVPTGGSVWGTWSAAGFVEGGLALVGSRGLTAPRADVLFIFLGGVTGPGTYEIDALEQGGTGVLAFDADLVAILSGELDPGDVETAYLLTSGSVHIATLSATRVTGTLEASGRRSTGLGDRLHLTGGSFDVPLVDDGGIGGSTH